MNEELQDLKARIINALDPEELVERLNIPIEELVEILSDAINSSGAFYDLEDNS